ncbi:hypothetical protein AX14_002443 [Amanita brunnescens Koide BX004]|nr:hypothetical protein AX14_002443 [Amanita brunnescens Koide BX004]
MARRPSPNVTPFIPPLSSPNPSPHPQPLTSAPATPYVNPYTSYLPAAAPVAYPGYPYPPFASPQGLSADYAGYPAFLGPTPLAQPVHLPPAHPSPWTPPHTTPWAQHAQLPQYPPFQPQQAFYHPHATPAMQYGQFSPDPWGMPPQPAHPPNPRNTWPAHPQQPLHQPPAPQRPISRSAVYSADRVDPFLPGSCYGPVLTPFLVGVVRAEVKLNPLITPLPEDGSDKPHLRWNMLYTSNYCQRSDDKPHVSWSKGREAPATFPRVISMRIITELMPWTVEVNAQNHAIGVTCGEVIDSISDCLYRIASASDYNALPDARKRAVSESYHHNRSVAADVPGGRLKHGMMRLDFLCKYSMYGGIELDNQFSKKTTGFSVVEHVNFYPRGTSCAEDVKKAGDVVYPAAMHFKLLTILALICSPVALAGVPLSYNPAYDNGATSINAVACSDGLNGLGTRGYKTLGSLPHFPYIGGAPAIESWNSTNSFPSWLLTRGMASLSRRKKQ